MNKRRVLILIDWYSPGFKAGGPIRSIVNFVSSLKDDLDLWVFTADRDLGDREPYRDVIRNEWLDDDGVMLYYASPDKLSWLGIASAIKQADPEIIYLNSVFSRFFTVYPLLMKRLGLVRSCFVLSPRGMLKNSALAHKASKKKFFLLLANAFGLFNDVIFHASDRQEKDDIVKQANGVKRIFVAGNFPAPLQEFQEPPEKIRGALCLLFVGRVHPIKNLDFLLRLLKGVDGRLDLEIVAPIEDNVYWELCLEEIKRLPPEVRVVHHQHMEHKDIQSIIQKAHLFVLPTKGENFGHAIFEALSCGRPVLISDQTPWKGLKEVKAGFDLPLDDEGAFSDALGFFISMEHEELRDWCKGAWYYCKKYLDDLELRSIYLNIFN